MLRSRENQLRKSGVEPVSGRGCANHSLQPHNQRPEKPEKPEPLDITYEWAADYNSDNYGLVIRLRRNTNWPIRLYMNSDTGFKR